MAELTIANHLNVHLVLEISAAAKYAGHACLIRYHGYTKLADRYQEEAKEEQQHADKLAWRIQELGEIPDFMPELEGETIKHWDIGELLASDLETEKAVLESLRECNDLAEEHSDYATSEVLRCLITETQGHVTWLSTQVTLLKEIGSQNYLQAWL